MSTVISQLIGKGMKGMSFMTKTSSGAEQAESATVSKSDSDTEIELTGIAVHPAKADEDLVRLKNALGIFAARLSA